MLSKRLRFEMDHAIKRIEEIRDEYNNDLTKGREKISEIKYNKSDGTIAIFLDSYAYYIFIYKHAYILTWLRRDINNEHRWINDGAETCEDISSLIRSINDRIFGGFSPRRGRLWYQFGLTKQRKNQFEKNRPA